MASSTDTIPEIQLIKKKYPQYNDIDDNELLTLVSKRYPVYNKLADRYQGSITQRKPDLNDMLGYRSEDVERHPIREFIQGTAQGQFMNRPFGAVQAMTAGKSPVEGFQRPDEQPSFKESAGRAWKLNYKDPVQDIVGNVLDLGLQLGTAHLIMGVPIKAAAEGARAWYYEPLHTMAKNEFKEAGFSDENAHKAATHIVNNAEKLGFKARSPEAIAALKEQLKGKLGTSLKEHVQAAETSAKTYGIEPRRLMSPEARKLLTVKTAGEPSTDFGQQLKQDIQNRPPFTPESYMGTGRKPVVSTTETTPMSKMDRLKLLNEIKKTQTNIKLIKEDLPNLQMGEAHDAQSHIEDLQNHIDNIISKLKLSQSTQPPTTIKQPSGGQEQPGELTKAAVTPASLKTTPTTQPTAQLRPAIKIKEGEYAVAKPGEHHDDIVKRRPELKNKQRGFVDQNNKFLNRTEAAAIIGQKEPLHSEDLPQTKPRIDKIKAIAQEHASKKTMTFIDRGTPTEGKVQPLTPSIQPVNTLHNVHVETPTGDKMMTMNTKQLMDFKDNLKEENKLGIKIKEVTPLSSDDPKFKAYQDQIEKINKMRKKCQD